MDWLEWFNFSQDPFMTRPLQSDDEFKSIFVKTASIENELTYIIKEIKLSSFLKLVVGKRGIGKSTALQYVVNLCKKMI